MGGTRDRHGIEEFWCGNLKERQHLADLGVFGNIIVQKVLNK